MRFPAQPQAKVFPLEFHPCSPLTSLGPRERRVNMATWLCSQMRDALNLDCEDGARELFT